MHRIFRWIPALLIGMAVATSNQSIAQGGEPSLIKVLDGAAGNFKVDSFATVEDTKWWTPTEKAKIDTTLPYNIRNIITLKLNEESTRWLASNFTTGVGVQITYTNKNSLVDSVIYDTLSVNYDSTSGATYNSQHIFFFQNAYRVKVKILGINTTYPGGVTAWNVLPHLRLENEMQIERYYNFSCTATPAYIINESFYVASTGELRYLWTKVDGATEYDFEWTYIDSVDLADANLYGTVGSPDFQKIFDAGATRVTVYNEQLYVPLFYDRSCYVFCRLRPVQSRPGNQRIEGNWYNGIFATYYFTGHETGLNWQSSMTFAEEAKRKTVIHYFDGSLKERQTVTKDNSVGNTIAAETLYDFQGRPAIQVLPAPTLNTAIKYIHDLNKTLSNDEYSKSVYDSLINPSDYCMAPSPAMNSSYGANWYYSSNNGLGHIYSTHKALPMAYGYAFAETRYAQDNTGRVMAQGGVGPQYQPGAGHETKYFYGKPDQQELDALFGTEAGDASHYQKNMVRDANGQYSVSYVDMHGRTVATALAGKPDSVQVDTLETYNKRTFTKRLNDPASTIIDGMSMQSSTGLVVTLEGPHTFRYTLSPDSLKLTNCDSNDICYDCVYNLEISISDECNNQSLPFGQRYVILDTNFTLGALDTICGNGVRGFDTTFTLNLTEGSYTISKRLSISTTGYEYYRDSVFLVKNLCKTFEDFYAEQLELLQQDCDPPTCEDCVEELGTLGEFTTAYGIQNGIPSGQLTQYAGQIARAYAIAKENCEILCDSLAENDAIREMMLLDMIPESGQYANPAITEVNYPYNIFYRESLGSLYNYQKIPFSIFYADANGKRDSIYNSSGILVPPSDASITPTQFIAQFKPSWANALLHQHPEYCRYFEYEALKASHIWDRRFQQTDTYADAKTKGYLNPVEAAGLPFLPNVQDDPLKTLEPELFDKLKAKAINYINDDDTLVSMWGLATATAHCNEGDTECFEDFTTAAFAFDTTSLCRGELDMAWRSFRQMYLTEKRRIINEYLDKFCPNDIPAKYVRRFPDLEAQIQDLESASTDPTTVLNESIDAVGSIYAANCEAYVQNWWRQLARCNFEEEDSLNIVYKLIQVCKEGSDATHPFGSSTVKPSSSYTFKSFDHVIEHYLDSTGGTYNADCNGYLINTPRPYQQPATYASLPLWTSPDNCQCERITGLYQQFLDAPAADSNFSGYLQRTLNVAMAQADLQELLNRCENQSACKFLEQPINLPPALQCGGASPCVGCDSITVWHGRFFDRFAVTPQYDDNDSTQSLTNHLYGNYMNFFSGFNKTYAEYLQFKDSCVANDSLGATCDSLKLILNDFRDSFYHKPSYSIVRNADGCDTISWHIASGALSTGKVKYRHIFDNGVVHIPDSLFNYVTSGNWADSVAIKSYFFTYPFTICNINNSFRWDVRLRHRRFPNPTGADGTLLLLHIYLASNPNVSTAVYVYLMEDQPGNISVQGNVYPSSQLQVDLTDWTNVSVRIEGNKIKVYTNGQFRAEAPYTGSIVKVSGLNVQPSFTETFIDYYRFFNGAGQLILAEDFNNACDAFAVMNPAYDCGKLPCDTAFTVYFNGQEGTSYSISQLQQQFITHCGKTAEPCKPADSKPVLCSDGELFPEMNIPDAGPCSDSSRLAFVLATELYKTYKDSLLAAFDSMYLAKCMKAHEYESFTVEAAQSEFHYTLYYYDQAGSLVKTVPPAGVDISKFGWASDWSDSVKTARTNSQILIPDHQLPTNYRYNTLGQAVAQHSPDGGQSRFWYDRLGRLVLSQNEKQAGEDWYSYTRYDSIGRITEVGELVHASGPASINDTITRDAEEMEDLVTLNTRRQITNTYYDAPYASFSAAGWPIVARNLRSRVSFSTYTETGNPAVFDQGTFYSYDIHGNVDTLVQDYRTGVMSELELNESQRFKKLVYQYDLISGKVNHVAYQPGMADQFYHRYSYDAENRLTEVFTSDRGELSPSGGVGGGLWERDALYSYLRHGPLGRTQLGQQKVQGQDHAYTLQGWLKAINGNGSGHEIGMDGTAGSPNQLVARDAYGMTLHYNNQDYSPVLSVCFCVTDQLTLPTGKTLRNLYNGNIAGMNVDIPKIAYPVASPAVYKGSLFYNYKYDQLNRIKEMEVYTRSQVSLNTEIFLDTLNDYRERVSYDGNGNILKYTRNGTTLNSKPLNMDSLAYKYYAGTNRLRQVRDSVNAANYTEDIDNQGDTSNYVYDAIGNLVQDKAEGIDSIKWNVYGKISNIYKSSGLKIGYTYDAGGNRVSKKVINGTDTTVTWYVRDATGNVMSTYIVKNDTATQDEIHLYGSSRIGILKPGRILNLDAQYGETSDTLTLLGIAKGRVSRRGQKFFELANHLGNVLVTISDKKLGIDTNGDSIVNYYAADVMTANDYYPFGMGMPERKFTATNAYRYGFNGKENDNEVKGEGNQQDYGMRIYDPRIGRFLSVDPLTRNYPSWSPYPFAMNRPLDGIDLDGLEYFNAWRFMQIRNSGQAQAKSTQKEIKSHVGINFSGAKMPKIAYEKKSYWLTNLVLNADAIGQNTAANVWNGGVQFTEDVSNLAFSSEGRVAVIDKYDQAITKAAITFITLAQKLNNGEITLEQLGSATIEYLKTPEGAEAAATFFASLATAKLSSVSVANLPPKAKALFQNLFRLSEEAIAAKNSAEVVEGGVIAAKNALSRPMRLLMFTENLKKAPSAKNPKETLGLINKTLNDVENIHAGPKDRMYGILDDKYVTYNSDGSVTALTKGHRIEIQANGSFSIFERSSGNLIFKKD